MGIITLALAAFVAGGHVGLPAWMLPATPESVPQWVVIVCAAAIGLGTAAGGKRIIKTMGTKIIRISPLQGFAAETSGAITSSTPRDAASGVHRRVMSSNNPRSPPPCARCCRCR